MQLHLFKTAFSYLVVGITIFSKLIRLKLWTTVRLDGICYQIDTSYTVSVKRRDCGLRTVDCGPGVKWRLCVKCRPQTKSKTQAWVKCRPSINCSRGRVKGKKIPQIHVNEHLLDDICFHKSIPFFSGTSSTTRKHNRTLEPFFPSERRHTSTLDEKFSTYTQSAFYPWAGLFKAGLT